MDVSSPNAESEGVKLFSGFVALNPEDMDEDSCDSSVDNREDESSMLDAVQPGCEKSDTSALCSPTPARAEVQDMKRLQNQPVFPDRRMLVTAAPTSDVIDTNSRNSSEDEELDSDDEFSQNQNASDILPLMKKSGGQQPDKEQQGVMGLSSITSDSLEMSQEYLEEFVKEHKALIKSMKEQMKRMEGSSSGSGDPSASKEYLQQCVKDEKALIKSMREQMKRERRNKRRKELVDCPHCGKRMNRGSLSKHVNAHNREKRFRCSICDEQYDREDYFERHMSFHFDERPFKCPKCGKGFKEERKMRKHTFSHSGEKPFICSLCNKAFSDSSALYKHLRSHNGEKPYECSVCGKAFNESSKVVRHMRIHTGEKPFECPICKRAFNDKSSRTKHIRTHEKELARVAGVGESSLAAESVTDIKGDNLLIDNGHFPKIEYVEVNGETSQDHGQTCKLELGEFIGEIPVGGCSQMSESRDTSPDNGEKSQGGRNSGKT